MKRKSRLNPETGDWGITGGGIYSEVPFEENPGGRINFSFEIQAAGAGKREHSADRLRIEN